MLYSLGSSDLKLETAGGKAVNLAQLHRAGFNVPAGFVLSTEAYRCFIQHNNLEPTIVQSLQTLSTDQTSTLEQASATIRSAFTTGQLPSNVFDAIEILNQELGDQPVAVRSSATAEDLPGLSFAGQQDTFLNVVGKAALKEAVIGCWSSLWTARAIGYRNRNQIPQKDAAIAVVIQQMVPSDVSGVLFTANPLNGLRCESVIDATFGLGEALVSGQVEPDHFVINHLTHKISAQSLGKKQVSTQLLPEGGVKTSRGDHPTRITLNQDQIGELVRIGQQIQNNFGAPQDIEWSYHDEKLYILQSRPITSLFPVPELSFDPLIAWISFGSVQGLLGPITPLGREGIKNVLVGAASLFGSRIRPEEQSIFESAGERIWIRISDLIRNPMGNRIFEPLMHFIEPSVVGILGPLREEPELAAGKGRLRFKTLRRVIGFMGPVLIRAIQNASNPESARETFDRQVNDYLASIERPTASDRLELLSKSLQLMRSQIQSVFQFVIPRFVPILAPGMASLVLLSKLSGERGDLALEITRSLPNNVTTQMDLALWEVAKTIKFDKGALALFESLDANSLADHYLSGRFAGSVKEAIDSFLNQYGMRAVGEIDIGQTRWRENPAPVFATIQSYLRLASEHAPDVVFARGEQSAEDAIEALTQSVRAEPFGRIKAHIARAAARRVRALLGARETPKFLAIQTMGIIREALLRSGTLFVQAGILSAPDDLFFLHMHELEELSHGKRRDWQSLIEIRREEYEREKRRRLVPRVLLSDGRAYYEGVGAATDTEQSFRGSPVSPGVVEGKIHVVLDPHNVQLEPGEILVCPGTDPAWTPLFLTAGGLITEVGGMMTHGSVVAREYGIPAVVGVHEATTRLRDGQKIRLDGSEGTITLLE
ncbi:MAG: PEP/pyruvate-binding domain-containing protein [Anaerolineales bacterium]|jgi:pyruvate,water dikinase